MRSYFLTCFAFVFFALLSSSCTGKASTPVAVRDDDRVVVSPGIGSREIKFLQQSADDIWRVEGVHLTRRKLILYEAVRDSIIVLHRNDSLSRDTTVERRMNALRGGGLILQGAGDTSVFLIDRKKGLVRVASENGNVMSTWDWSAHGEPRNVCLVSSSENRSSAPAALDSSPPKGPVERA